jgi:hypothetical protein
VSHGTKKRIKNPCCNVGSCTDTHCAPNTVYLTLRALPVIRNFFEFKGNEELITNTESTGTLKRTVCDCSFLWRYVKIQGDQKVFVHLMITIQKVTSNVQSVPRQSPDIYWHYTNTNAICYP